MFAILCALLIPPPAAPEPIVAPKLVVVQEGYWEAEGTIDGKEYTSLVMIQKQGASYIVLWVGAGADQHIGCGTLDGDCLLVGFGSGAGMRGIASFEVGDGKLVGWWASLPGNGRRQKETMTFIKPFKVKTP